MIKKRYIVIALGIVSVLLGSFLVNNVILAQSGGEYDPWLDYNEDGIIDANDLYPLGQGYGSSGDPTKNVNVTNWPVELQLFPETLTMKTAVFATLPWRYDLIDEAAPYLPSPIYYDPWTPTTVGTTPVTVYNRTFIYQDIPTRPYQILGMPTLSVPFNMTNTTPVMFNFNLTAYLGKISFNGEWTQLQYLGYMIWTFGGTFSDFLLYNQFGAISSPLNITISAYERLAIRFVALAWTSSGTTSLTLELLCDENEHGIICIPLVKP